MDEESKPTDELDAMAVTVLHSLGSTAATGMVGFTLTLCLHVLDMQLLKPEKIQRCWPTLRIRSRRQMNMPSQELPPYRYSHWSKHEMQIACVLSVLLSIHNIINSYYACLSLPFIVLLIRGVVSNWVLGCG